MHLGFTYLYIFIISKKRNYVSSGPLKYQNEWDPFMSTWALILWF